MEEIKNAGISLRVNSLGVNGTRSLRDLDQLHPPVIDLVWILCITEDEANDIIFERDPSGFTL